MHPDIAESTEVRDICDRGGRRSGRKRPLLADIRQTTNSVNPLCVIRRSCGPELVAEGKTLRDIICKARPHMVDEQIGKKLCFDIGKRWRLGD